MPGDAEAERASGNKRRRRRGVRACRHAGLYFGEGPVSAIGKDAIGGPILAAGGQLLEAIVDASTP